MIHFEKNCSSKRTDHERKPSVVFSILVSLCTVPTSNDQIFAFPKAFLNVSKMFETFHKLSTNFPQSFHSLSCFVIHEGMNSKSYRRCRIHSIPYWLPKISRSNIQDRQNALKINSTSMPLSKQINLRDVSDKINSIHGKLLNF